MIGPVDRTGNKTQNSINYLLEGKLWCCFNFFCYLYPDSFQPAGALNFTVKKDSASFIYVVKTLEKLLRSELYSGKYIIPKIKTQLYDHQKRSTELIMNKFNQGYKGHGDASDVGSGKTLTALTIASRLIESNENMSYSGILVLVPGNKLLPTWEEEINKHTKGFQVVNYMKEVPNIKSNTLILTTVGRIRDHPLEHNWLLVVIDECLSVQNKNALQTEQAFIQSLSSRHVIMMSATFFRARFDKLYYMLKMLHTGLPSDRLYLNAILSESIVAQISSIKRKWKSNIHKFTLDNASRKQYGKIEKSDLSTELKYAKLNSLLTSDNDMKESIVKQLGKLIRKLDKRKCLLYARSKAEAQYWSENLDIPVYPKKSTHCIVTLNDGTYGLNDLVCYDTLIIQPPSPDKLPQIKGRLDRPGQKKDLLYIEYFIVENTIEEGLLLRLEMASQFVHNYIMPLAKFYDISLHWKTFQLH